MYPKLISPNKWYGRKIYKPEAFVIHICEGTFYGTQSWFMNPKSQVSAHFLISKQGEILQMVDPADTAWHTGVIVKPSWQLLKPNVNPNFYTIGIELTGYAAEKPTMAEIFAAAKVVKNMALRFNIPINNQHIIPHRWIHSGKTCPGPNVNVDVISYLANLPIDK